MPSATRPSSCARTLLANSQNSSKEKIYANAPNAPAGACAALTTIYSFTGANGDGEYPFPEGAMRFDSKGALYGTTASGGTNYNGTVFQLVPPTQPGGAWTENVLYRFAGGADGRQPSTSARTSCINIRQQSFVSMELLSSKT